ncbi:MAG TPA: DedA family protein [Chloroflexota bacterium]|nr:DedA family protein [Chloroflexota bacterium]
MHLAAHELTHLLNVYGYWAVLGMVLLESMGIPLPAETMLLTAAIYAGKTGNLFIGWVIAAAAVGAIAGDNIGFTIGREGGFRLLRRYGRYIRLDDKKIKLGQYLFLKHGATVVFVGRFVAVLRAWAAFIAGVARMPWSTFFVANAAGGILWATVYGLLGWGLGDVINQFRGRATLFLGLAGAAAVIAGLVFLAKNERRLEEEADRMLPGPLQARPRLRPQRSLDSAAS